MEKNTQEKNLIEKKEKGIFNKIKSFFKKLFNNGQDNNQVVSADNNILNENDNEFRDYIKMTEDEETKLLELQRKYREGEIAEDDLTDEQIEALSNLYDKQIQELKKSIEIREQKIAEYKKRKAEKKNA